MTVTSRCIIALMKFIAIAHTHTHNRNDFIYDDKLSNESKSDPGFHVKTRRGWLTAQCTHTAATEIPGHIRTENLYY